MRAMILAAGRGERMRPLTDHTPKPLLAVGGKPLIVWHIERLQRAGFTQIVINHAHLGEQIEKTLGNGEKWGLKIDYSPEQQALETAGGIAKALPIVSPDGLVPFLVVNGDVYTDIDFSAINLRRHDLIHLVMVPNPPHNPKGDFAVSQGRLLVDGESTFTFSGVGVYHPALFKGVNPNAAYPLAPLLRQAITEGKAAATLHGGQWHDIGTPQRLSEINAWLASQTKK